MWIIWWAPNNASKWQMEFNSAFKGLKKNIFHQVSKIKQPQWINKHFDILQTIKFILFSTENKSKISHCTCKSLQNPNNRFWKLSISGRPTTWLWQLLAMPYCKMLSYQLLITEVWFQSQVSPRWTCGGQSSNGTEYYLTTSAPFWQVLYTPIVRSFLDWFTDSFIHPSVPWCHSVTNASISMVTMWKFNVCHISMEVTIKFLASAWLLSLCVPCSCIREYVVF